MPPVPTFPTVKLRPWTLSDADSRDCLVFLEDDLVERCLKTSVLSFTRRSVAVGFFSDALGAELFLTCLRDTSVSGVFVLFLGLEPYCEADGIVVLWVVPVI
jgi:hypothetical protein